MLTSTSLNGILYLKCKVFLCRIETVSIGFMAHKRKPWAVAEPTFHLTSTLRGNRYDHFVFKVYFVVWHGVYLLGKTEEVSLDVVLFPVVSYVEPFQQSIRVAEDSSCPCLVLLYHSVTVPFLNDSLGLEYPPLNVIDSPSSREPS